MTTRLGSSQLLAYNGIHGVLICRECQYAIQKSAVRSHLLRHKIYRSERAQLLAEIDELHVLEPADILLPDPRSAPIQGLPVSAGRRCTSADCGHLCVSDKRMRRHWSECHGSDERSSRAQSISCISVPARLQTFFRGTKIRYFEVSVSRTPDGSEEVTATPSNHGTVASQEQDGTARGSGSLTQSLASEDIIDLKFLTYFHHFTTKTALTLPIISVFSRGTSYWQSKVVLQALQHGWLMSGLLAISAFHIGVTYEDVTARKVHATKGAQWAKSFWIGRDETLSDQVPAQLKAASEAIGNVLQCAQWSSSGAGPGMVAPFSIQALIANLQGSISSAFNDNRGTTATRKDLGAQRVRHVPDLESPVRYGGPAFVDTARLTAATQMINSLPSRMAEAFGRPADAVDVLATLSAMSPLIECCNIAFASTDIHTVWIAMVGWLDQMPNRFREMVAENKPAALVLVANWSGLLVQRAEELGCWYLQELPAMVLAHTQACLSTESVAVRSLVVGVRL